MTSLYIRDSEVNALAMKVLKASNSKNKTEAVRRACKMNCSDLSKKGRLLNALQKFNCAFKTGLVKNYPPRDHKALMDEGWEL